MRIVSARTRVPVPRQVRLLVTARAVNQLGAFSLAFLTVLMCRDFGASLAAAGAVSAAFGLATIPSRLLCGRAAGRAPGRPAWPAPHDPDRPARLRGRTAWHRGRARPRGGGGLRCTSRTGL